MNLNPKPKLSCRSTLRNISDNRAKSLSKNCDWTFEMSCSRIDSVGRFCSPRTHRLNFFWIGSIFFKLVENPIDPTLIQLIIRGQSTDDQEEGGLEFVRFGIIDDSLVNRHD